MRLNIRMWSPAQFVSRRSFCATAARETKYAFVGLGQMGYNMATNLQKNLEPADSIRVFDVNQSATDRFVQETKDTSGAEVQVASSFVDAVKDSDTTITVLPEPAHVRDIFQQYLKASLASESDQHRAATNPDRLFIDCSTIDPTTSRKVANAVQQEKQGQFVDAPMSGGVVGARAGTLTFMLGSPSSLLPRIEPILLKMGARVLHCGPQGSGLAGKLANNYLLAINNIATAEAMNMGIKLGLDARVLGNLINTSTGRCWPSQINNPVAGVIEGAPAERDFSGGFGIGLMKKDLNLALAAAREADAKLVLGGRAAEVYAAAGEKEDCKGRDFSVVYKYIRD